MRSLSDLSNDDLADGICTWAGRIAAGEAELLSHIAEFDRREAWGGPGLLSCAHWLSWRIGLSPGAAREKVRVGRALDELPVIREAFVAGRLSFSQVRAITRAATPDDQMRWVELARSTTAGQLERLVRGVRRATKPERDAADPVLAAWRMRARKNFDADGNAVYTIVLPAEQAAVLDAALEAVRCDLDAQRELDAERGADADVSAETPSPQAATALGSDVSAETSSPQAVAEATPARATLADALLEMARGTLERQAAERPDAARRGRSALVAQIDPLTGWGRLRDGELLPPASLKTALRTLPGRAAAPLRRLTPADLRRCDLGREQRVPSLALRELLGTLDGERCRFPGCTRHRKLHAHHVLYWGKGGRTDLDNLLLLCSRHHTLVHAQGFQLELHDDRSVSVATADGVPVLHHPALPWRPATELDPEHRVSAETLPPDTVEARMDLGYAVMVVAQQAA